MTMRPLLHLSSNETVQIIGLRFIMANVFDVAKYIIEKAGKGGKMSTMKLQKLVFYSQAYSLGWKLHITPQ